MKTILHIDASARGGLSGTHRFGSHSRRLSHRFVAAWGQRQPGDIILYRDIGQSPPAMVSGEWIHAAFTPEPQRQPWMRQTLAESDRLIDEIQAADIIVLGVPMYNFSVPAQLKAWIDNVVRLGRTFGFDRSKEEPYWPMLAEKPRHLVIIASRGDVGYGAGERVAHLNHVEAAIRTPLAHLGITQHHEIAVEGDEWADERLAGSLLRAEAAVDALAAKLAA